MTNDAPISEVRNQCQQWRDENKLYHCEMDVRWLRNDRTHEIDNEVSICFTIEAEDEDAAIIKAQKFVDSIDSVPLDTDRDDCEDEDKDVMFYTSNETVITSDHIVAVW